MKRLPLKVNAALHYEFKKRAINLGWRNLQTAADAMLDLWLKLPDKKVKP